MSATRIARRRRKQHVQGFTHLHRRQRPKYSRSAGSVRGNRKK